MTRLIIISLAAALLATSGQAREGQSSIRENIKMELPKYGYPDVDVDGLTTLQVARIHALLHSNNGVAHIRGGIGAALGNTIWELLK